MTPQDQEKMTEARAREIVAKAEREVRETGAMRTVHHEHYFESRGYLSGLEDERRRRRKLSHPKAKKGRMK